MFSDVAPDGAAAAARAGLVLPFVRLFVSDFVLVDERTSVFGLCVVRIYLYLLQTSCWSYSYLKKNNMSRNHKPHSDEEAEYAMASV